MSGRCNADGRRQTEIVQGRLDLVEQGATATEQSSTGLHFKQQALGHDMHRWRKTKAGESRFLDGLNFICCIMLAQHDARAYRHGTCHALATANALFHGSGIGMVDKALAAMRLVYRNWQGECLRQASLNAVER